MLPIWGFQFSSRGVQGIPSDMNSLAVNTVAPNDIISLASDFVIIIMISLIEAQLCSSALTDQERSGSDP